MYKSRFRENFESGDDPFGLENMYARQRASTERLNKAQLKEQQRNEIEASKGGVMSGALAGASIGSMGGVGWGTAAGAVIGGIAGGAKEIMGRRSAGQGWTEAMGGTVGQSLNPGNLLKGNNAESAARIAAKMGASGSSKYGQSLDDLGGRGNKSNADFATYNPAQGQAYADYWNMDAADERGARGLAPASYVDAGAGGYSSENPFVGPQATTEPPLDSPYLVDDEVDEFGNPRRRG